MRTVKLFASFFVLLLAAGLSMPANASAPLNPKLTALCYQAIAQQSSEKNVPSDVMLAISLTETGRKLDGRVQPWPWTVNMEGKGVWFPDKASALAYVRKHFERGARSFDVGCFQINYKWHHQHFASIEDMFEPQVNAAYAARFLSDLFRETGSWSLAAGAYHSRTPKYANRYRQRFDRYRSRLADGGIEPEYQGHGSEALVLAEAPQEEPTPYQPLSLDIGRTSPLLSSTSRPMGSLFGSPTASSGLLRRSKGSLF